MKRVALWAGLIGAALAPSSFAEDHDWDRSAIRHVLLISVDGMHAVDYLNCANGVSSINGGEPYCPNLADLGTTGINYLYGSTSRPSDSFPGLMNIVTGGTPRSMGVFYDVAYDRSLAPPAKTTGNGLAGGTCTPGVLSGTTTEYEEGIEFNQTLLNGGNPGASLIDGGIGAIDPARLVRDPSKNCAPVYPWNFVRDNTIFGVIHAAGGYTAWSDKHHRTLPFRDLATGRRTWTTTTRLKSIQPLSRCRVLRRPPAFRVPAFPILRRRVPGPIVFKTFSVMTR